MLNTKQQEERGVRGCWARGERGAGLLGERREGCWVRGERGVGLLVSQGVREASLVRWHLVEEARGRASRCLRNSGGQRPGPEHTSKVRDHQWGYTGGQGGGGRGPRTLQQGSETVGQGGKGRGVHVPSSRAHRDSGY